MNRGLLNSRTFSNIKQSTGGKPPEKVGASWQQTRRQVSQEEAGALEKVSVFIQGASPVAEQQRICLQCRRPRRGAFDLWVGRIPWRRKGSPLKSSCLENPTDRGAQRAPVRGVAESRTRLSLTEYRCGAAHTAGRLCVWTRARLSVQAPAFGRSWQPRDAPSCPCSSVKAHKFGREGKDLQKNWGELQGEACSVDPGGGMIPEDGWPRVTLKEVEVPWPSEN